jgi:hypothetical protein
MGLQTNGPTVGECLGGNVLPELSHDARVRILNTKIGSRDIVIYASDTKSKQIGLFFYDSLNGEFISSRYLGHTYPLPTLILSTFFMTFGRN